MKTLIITAALALSSTSAFAQNIQSNSDWAIAMTSRACNIDVADLKGAEGKKTKVEGGVVYTVTMNGEVVASAFAKNTGVFAKKTCLN